MLRNDGVLQKLLGGGALAGIELEHQLDDGREIRRVALWKGRILASHHLVAQRPFCLRQERMLQRRQLVEEHAQRPDVAAFVILLVLPQLRRHVVGSANLGVRHAVLGALCNTEVADLDRSWPRDEDVRSFDVAVQDIGCVQVLEPLADLDKEGPDQVLREQVSAFHVPLQLRIHVAAPRQLGDDPQAAPLHESIVVAHNAWALDARRQDAHLVHAVLALLLFHRLHVELLQRVPVRPTNLQKQATPLNARQRQNAPSTANFARDSSCRGARGTHSMLSDRRTAR